MSSGWAFGQAGGRKQFDLTFDLAIVMLSLQILSGIYLGNRKVYTTSWCDLNLTFDLAIMIMGFKILFKLFLGFSKV